jgi:hypothetical protein
MVHLTEQPKLDLDVDAWGLILFSSVIFYVWKYAFNSQFFPSTTMYQLLFMINKINNHVVCLCLV